MTFLAAFVLLQCTGVLASDAKNSMDRTCGTTTLSGNLSFQHEIHFCVYPLNRSMQTAFTFTNVADNWTDASVELVASGGDHVRDGKRALDLTIARDTVYRFRFECLASDEYHFQFRGERWLHRNQVETQARTSQFPIETWARPDVDNWNVEVSFVRKCPNSIQVQVFNDAAHREFGFSHFKLELRRGEAMVQERDFCLKEWKEYATTFEGLEEGNYTLLISPDDCRCWEGRCYRHGDRTIVIKDDYCHEHPHPAPGSGNVGIWIGFGLSVTLAVICGLVLLSRFDGNLFRRNSVSEQRAVQSVEVNTAATATRTAMPEVLLLYDYQDEFICRKARALGAELVECGAPRVHDYADEDQSDSVSVEGVDWFANRIGNDAIKIVLIMTDGLANCQRQITNGGDILPHQILLHAMNQIHLYTVRNHQRRYARVYRIKFSDVDLTADGDQLGPGIGGPFTLFTLPSDMPTLVNELKENP